MVIWRAAARRPRPLTPAHKGRGDDSKSSPRCVHPIARKRGVTNSDVASSTEPCSGGLARRDDAVVVQVDMSELRVGLLPRQLDRAAGLGRAAADLRYFKLETADQVDARAVLIAGNRIANGLALHIDQTVDADVPLAGIDVDGDVDRFENRIEHLLQRGGEDAPDGGEGLGLLAGEDGAQRLALRLVGPLVDDQQGLAVAFMDRSRPLHHADGLQPVQLHVAEMAFLDGEAADGLAEAVRRRRIELAPAAIGAVAGDQLVGLNNPGNHDGASSVMRRLDEGAASYS